MGSNPTRGSMNYKSFKSIRDLVEEMNKSSIVQSKVVTVFPYEGEIIIIYYE